MEKRNVQVVLTAPGANSVTAAGTLCTFAPFDRVKGAALVFGGSVLLACTLIPIPIIHLLGIPLLLLTGIVLAARQLNAVARLLPLRIACPKCGALNRVGGGLGYHHPELGPGGRTCDSCRRNLIMQIVGQ